MSPALQRAEVKDPVNDVPKDSRIAVSPDLIEATATIEGGNITFVIRFAPGTADRSTTWVRINLDTDRNPATGRRERNGMGTDYSILALASGRTAALQKEELVGCAERGACTSQAGSVLSTFADDTMQVLVPLSLLGSDENSHMFFQLRAWPVIPQASLVGVMDAMPKDELLPGYL